MRNKLLSVVGVLLLAGFLANGVTGVAWGEDWKDRLDYLLADGFRLEGLSMVYNADKNLNLFTDFATLNDDGNVTTVIEIPAGTNGKWEVTEETGVLSWELKNGQPRLIKYLAYPWNYGMIPRTMGGDGDSLDMLSLGPMVLRGTAAEVKLIGVVRLLDGEEEDDKLIGVLPGSTFWEVNSIPELQTKYPGVLDIIQIWIANYKGPGAVEIQGVGDVDEAWDVLNAGIAAYNN
jgi:inorganic pyrophosphatase